MNFRLSKKYRKYFIWLEAVIERAESGDKHDGAFLFGPDGRLIHSGVKLDHWAKKIIRAYGFHSYYEVKKSVEIKEGGTRLEAAIIHSMLFLGASFASISSNSKNPKTYLVRNNHIYKIIR